MERIKLSPGDLPQAEPIRQAMGTTRRLAERINLATMTPRPDAASSGYCLADPGKEYLIYLPQGGVVTVDLSKAPGPFAMEWIDPRSGTVTQTGTVSGGANRTLKPRSPGETVVYLRTVENR
jgi:hypothetical protein